MDQSQRPKDSAAVCYDLNLDPMAEYIYPDGGSIALGHPAGITVA
ncbi:MAG: hypothetical protein ABJE99_04945 [Roseobacter sp.]